MNTKTKIAGLLVAVMALSVPMVYADNYNGGQDPSQKDGAWHREGKWHHGPQDHMFAKILNLSDDQVKQLKDAHQKQREAMKSLFEQIKTNREDLNTEITKATPDMNKVNTLETQLKALVSQMVDNRLNSIMEIKKIMTPEQFAGYMALKKERKMMMHMMKDHGKFGGKDGACKFGDGHKHWGDKEGKDQDND